MNELQGIQFIPQLVDTRFFTAPTLSRNEDGSALQARLTPQPVQVQKKKRDETMRYAAYIRISTEEQVGNFSVDAQKRAIQSWVIQQEGTLTHMYIDEAQSGRSSNRPEFQAMRRDAKNGKFDAIIVHKFDRFARNRTESLAIKSLLRQDYGIKVFSVSEPSEDSDGAIGALIEGIMESVADWYSRNLATEAAKGKRERAMQGYHNNAAPFGYDRDKNGLLIANPKEVKGLKMAYEAYATGNESFNTIARMLNDAGYRSKTGNRFTNDTVRAMLRNKTYLGYVKYQKYVRQSNGRRSRNIEIEWFEGKHDAILDKELFEHVGEVITSARKRINHHYRKHRVYLLRNLIYCADCIANMPPEVDKDTYGKMRPQYNNNYIYYRCRARDYGLPASHPSVKADEIEEQVVNLLRNLNPPNDWRTKMIEAIGELLGDRNLDERIKEIKDIIKRMDFRWDQGFITDKNHYLEQRVKLQQELERLCPIPDDELERAADILENFDQYWQETEEDRVKQANLIELIVAQVWVRDDKVVAISLRPNFHVSLGLQSTKPTEISVSSLQQRERRDLNPRSPA